jgi:hypothetical protein
MIFIARVFGFPLALPIDLQRLFRLDAFVDSSLLRRDLLEVSTSPKRASEEVCRVS